MAAPTVHNVSVSRTARYAVLGTPASAREWWIVLHGYGQLATDFIEAFVPIATENRCIIAPEGLSRFYVDGMDEHKQVGASWMTREAREDEINDYVRALNAVTRDLDAGGERPPLHVVGFSQGAATASRWAALGETPIHRLILWSGAPARDLDLSAHAEMLASADLTLVVGDNDPYVGAEARDAVVQRLEAHNIPVTLYTFEGGHRIDRSTLQTLANS